MQRVYNFSAGPSVLPKTVLEIAQKELLNYENSGQSVMEMSHRSDDFKNILKQTKLLLRRIMKIPYNYEILFLQGGASSQFAMVPMNLMTKNRKADFIITGQWANKAYLEAQKYGKCKVIASSEDKNFSYIPKVSKEDFSKIAITLIFALTIQYTVRSLLKFQIPEKFLWWQTCHLAYCQSQ